MLLPTDYFLKVLTKFDKLGVFKFSGFWGFSYGTRNFHNSNMEWEWGNGLDE